jgi:hypothetical protein
MGLERTMEQSSMSALAHYHQRAGIIRLPAT